jgi:predicted DNA-binding transcriptional regulator YafY
MTSEKAVRILYTNYRGETALRKILPIRVHFGETRWHPEPQWLLDAMDVEKGEERSFAMKDIRAWLQP